MVHRSVLCFGRRPAQTTIINNYTCQHTCSCNRGFGSWGGFGLWGGFAIGLAGSLFGFIGNMIQTFRPSNWGGYGNPYGMLNAGPNSPTSTKVNEFEGLQTLYQQYNFAKIGDKYCAVHKDDTSISHEAKTIDDLRLLIAEAEKAKKTAAGSGTKVDGGNGGGDGSGTRADGNENGNIPTNRPEGKLTLKNDHSSDLKDINALKNGDLFAAHDNADGDDVRPDIVGEVSSVLYTDENNEKVKSFVITCNGHTYKFEVMDDGRFKCTLRDGKETDQNHEYYFNADKGRLEQREGKEAGYGKIRVHTKTEKPVLTETISDETESPESKKAKEELTKPENKDLGIKVEDNKLVYKNANGNEVKVEITDENLRNAIDTRQNSKKISEAQTKSKIKDLGIIVEDNKIVYKNENGNEIQVDNTEENLTKAIETRTKIKKLLDDRHLNDTWKRHVDNWLSSDQQFETKSGTLYEVIDKDGDHLNTDKFTNVQAKVATKIELANPDKYNPSYLVNEDDKEDKMPLEKDGNRIYVRLDDNNRILLENFLQADCQRLEPVTDKENTYKDVYSKKEYKLKDGKLESIS